MNIKVCRNCGKFLDDKEAVYSHVQVYAIHTDLKPLEYEMCSDCKRWFNGKQVFGILKKYKEIDK